MPNHVTNVVRTSPEVAQAFVRKRTPREIADHWRKDLDPDERVVDFAMLIPTPDDYISDGCSHDHGFLRGVEDPFPNCWYSWNRENWGTKWNAYDAKWKAIEGDRIELRFDTAWSHPAPVILALSEKFPDEAIEVEWADEDLGSNCGSYVIADTVMTHLYHPDYGDESLDFAAKVKYGMSYAEYRAQWGDDEDEGDAEGNA